ncbi:MAG: type II toxin-antitoxin system VapC family toxin [Cyanobacteria bacterium P01_H01_bin.152]
MRETVYIETSILGYLTARPTNNLILAANTKVTQDWWENYRSEFTLYASELVQNEAAQGDGAIATQRLSLLDPIPFLEITEDAIALGQAFLQQSNLPAKAANDSLHMALATVYGLNYLLTWNCKHMANAQIQKKLAQISEQLGYELPVICTPYELMGYEPVEE